MTIFVRWKYRFLRHWHCGEELNHRVKIEQYLFDCASGKKPLPDAAKCRELALDLGTPPWAKRMIGSNADVTGLAPAQEKTK